MKADIKLRIIPNKNESVCYLFINEKPMKITPIQAATFVHYFQCESKPRDKKGRFVKR